jgi:hypothetical protein
MAEAGWTPNQFVYVIHAYRETTANLRQAPPGENIMALTPSNLLELYGSFGRILEYAWLRRELAVAPQAQLLAVSEQKPSAMSTTTKPTR